LLEKKETLGLTRGREGGDKTTSLSKKIFGKKKGGSDESRVSREKEAGRNYNLGKGERSKSFTNPTNLRKKEGGNQNTIPTPLIGHRGRQSPRREWVTKGRKM